ncbi:MAG: DUF4153 domain-containing protein [Ignavibacteriales bacterium]|nr:DUF4153 domain-containing protein [Ignavibacteriales bacterium]
MIKLPSIDQILSGARESFLRFPLVLINAVIGTVIAIVLVEHEGPVQASILFNILYATLQGIPLLLAIALSVEMNQWKGVSALAANCLGLVLLIGYSLSTPSYINDIPLFHVFRFLFLGAAAHCLVAALPFVATGNQGGFWRFNIALLFRLFVSAFYSVVLMIGLSIGMVALDQLFGINVPGKRYAEMVLLIIGVFHTWFFLAEVPRDFQEPEESKQYPKELKIFSQYILAPIVLIYLVILYAYIVKITFLWSWPQGWVSRLIVGFSATGMVALLFLFPLRDAAEYRWVRIFWRWFFIALIPLLVLLPLAVLERISFYGITEGRYLGIAVALWLAAMVVYFLAGRRPRIQMIPASLCVALVVIGVGPWSASRVAENDQTGRLREVLVRNGILVEGVVKKAKTPVSIEDSRKISSIIQYLEMVHGYKSIQPWFPERLQSDSANGIPNLKSPAEVTRLMGVEFQTAWSLGNESFISLRMDNNEPLDINGFDRALSSRSILWNGKGLTVEREGISYATISSPPSLEFTVTSKEGMNESAVVNVEELAARVLKEFAAGNVQNIPANKMSVALQVSGRSLKIYFHSIQLRRSEGKMKPSGCTFEVFYTKM